MDRSVTLSQLLDRRFFVLVVLTLCSVHGLLAADQFTPVVVSPLVAQTEPFLGTDNKLHVVYELVLTNATPTSATLQKIEVLDGSAPAKVLAAYEGPALLARLRTMAHGAAQNLEIEFNGTRLLLLDLDFDPQSGAPSRLLHRVNVLAAPSPGGKPMTPVPLSYVVANVDLLTKVPVIGPPLSGKGWVAFNGCCGIGGAHRASSLPVNGKLYFAQRFAIDWMRLDESGRIVHGDASDVKNYTGYGADVLAVADGTVVDTLNKLDDQKPGSLPDPKTITVANVDGNHVVLDLGNGLFAFYAHLQKNSVKVAVGDHVRRGQVLGKLGNTGNTSAPHLHFHLMDSPSVLGSNGVPYVLDSFVLSGQISEAKFAASSGVEGDWSDGLFPTPSPRHEQFPLDLTIVDF